MGEVAVSPRSSSGRREPRPWALLVHHVVGWVLLGGFVVSVAGLVLLGSAQARPEALAEQLSSDAAAGASTTVWVEQSFGESEFDETSRAGGSWSAVVEVRWREALLVRHTEYVVASTPREAREMQQENDTSLPVAIGARDALPRTWTTRQPDLVVEQWERRGSPRASAMVFGVEWFAPSWAVWTGVVVGLATFMRVVVGPQPWRFTRWGWFWLVAGAWPVGVPAYLLFGGPAGLLPPEDPARRLSGWTGFGLTIVLGFLLGAALT